MDIEQVRKQALDHLLQHGNHPQAVSNPFLMTFLAGYASVLLLKKKGA